jgi:hypothetical protein
LNILSDIITYVRRIIKSPSNATITDNLIIDYINRFWIMDIDARLQLFDLKTVYQFQTIPGLDHYNMPMYTPQVQPGEQTIAALPVYQGFNDTCYVNGLQIPFYTERGTFYNSWPNYVQPLTSVAVGDGVTTDFTISLPFFPAIPGSLDMTGVLAYVNAGNAYQDPIFATSLPVNPDQTIQIPTTSFNPAVTIVFTQEDGNNLVINDTGIFLSTATTSQLYGLLMQKGNAPTGNVALSNNTYSPTQNTVNYATGVAKVSFPIAPPAGAQIQAQCYFYQPGIPRAVLYYNNSLKFRNPPDTQYQVELGAYLTPAAFLNSTQAIQFAYMCEYIARGAARKILSDTGDVEQFQFYEPLFLEQERLVWKRSQRQFTSTRTPTIFSDNAFPTTYNNSGGGPG